MPLSGHPAGPAAGFELSAATSETSTREYFTPQPEFVNSNRGTQGLGFPYMGLSTHPWAGWIPAYVPGEFLSMPN